MTESGPEPTSQPPSYPPPGATTPPSAPPSYPAPGSAPPPASGPPAAPGPATVRGPAPVVQPGAVPLRPLRLSDLFDSTFRILRHNPKASMGPALLFGLAIAVLQVLAAAVFTARGFGEIGALDEEAPTPESGVALTVMSVINYAGSLAQFVVIPLVTAMLAPVVLGAARGHKLSAGDSWAATAGKRLRVIGLAALPFLAALPVLTVALVASFMVAGIWVGVGGLAEPLNVTLILLIWFVAFAVIVYFWVRLFALATGALVLEPGIGIATACGRAWHLSRNQFWRIFLLYLLVGVVSSLVAAALATPVYMLGAFAMFTPGSAQLLLLSLGFSLGAFVATAAQVPILGCAQMLLYLDQRFRKEGLDIALMAEVAQPPAPPALG